MNAVESDSMPEMDPSSQVTLEIAREHPAATWWLEGGATSCSPAMRAVSEGERIVLGSGTGTDIRIFDRSVSARHCMVTVGRGLVEVADLGSKNGVFVGGARVDKAELGRGSSFVVGRVVVSCDASSRRSLADDAEPATLPGIVGGSIPIRRVAQEIRRLATVKGPVLLRGETGTGKDVLARALHSLGPRQGRPFIPLNVATLPRELADAELFGHERGAYTGAHGAREGAFCRAHGGTLFLDEVAELPPDLQVKLLRVLEDGEVRPLGGRTSRKVDVRVVSATWAPLHQRVAEGVFRQDLYQRLAVFVVDVPPLRDRRTDLPVLARHFLCELEAEVGPHELSPGALAKLTSYGWPGNIRELRNVLYRAALAGKGRLLGSGDIADSLELCIGPHKVSISPHQAHAVVDSHGGNVSAAARQLGVARSTFRDLLERKGGLSPSANSGG